MRSFRQGSSSGPRPWRRSWSLRCGVGCKARVNHVVDDSNAVKFLDGLPGDLATLRTAMSAGATHLDAVGISNSGLLSNEVWIGLTRKQFGIPLLTSSYNTMESELGCTETCLVCGDRLGSGGKKSLFCDGGTWGIIHTYLKHSVKAFLVALAADAAGRVTNVELEAKSQLASNNRSGDVVGNDNGAAFASEVFVVHSGGASNRGKDVDKAIVDADAAKRAHYAEEYKDSGVLFFTFGMDA